MINKYPKDDTIKDTVRTLRKLQQENYLSDISLHKDGMPISLQSTEFLNELITAAESIDGEYQSMTDCYQSVLKRFIQTKQQEGYVLTEADQMLLDAKNLYTENGIQQADRMREQDPEAFYTLFILEKDQREYKVGLTGEEGRTVLEFRPKNRK